MSYIAGGFSLESGLMNSGILCANVKSDISIALAFTPADDLSRFRVFLEHSPDNICTWDRLYAFLSPESATLKGLDRGKYRLRCADLSAGSVVFYEMEVKE